MAEIERLGGERCDAAAARHRRRLARPPRVPRAAEVDPARRAAARQRAGRASPTSSCGSGRRSSRARCVVGWDTLTRPDVPPRALRRVPGRPRVRRATARAARPAARARRARSGSRPRRPPGTRPTTSSPRRCARRRSAAARALVATSDRDSFQLASERTTILQPTRGVSELARVGPAEVRERYGVEPEQVPDFIALRGDPSDRCRARGASGRRPPPSLLRAVRDARGGARGRAASQRRRRSLRIYRRMATLDASAPLPPLRDQKPKWAEASVLRPRARPERLRRPARRAPVDVAGRRRGAHRRSSHVTPSSSRELARTCRQPTSGHPALARRGPPECGGRRSRLARRSWPRAARRRRRTILRCHAPRALPGPLDAPVDTSRGMVRRRHARVGRRPGRRRCSPPARRWRPPPQAPSRWSGRRATTRPVERAMGFCLFNNVASPRGTRRPPRRRSRRDRRLRRPSRQRHAGRSSATTTPSCYVSLHQWPFYPGTGGPGDRRETTRERPARAGSGDEEYLHAFERVVAPAVERFEPELVLVSAGFDAHEDDPLAEHARDRGRLRGARAPALRHALGRTLRGACSRAATTSTRCRASSQRALDGFGARSSSRRPRPD